MEVKPFIECPRLRRRSIAAAALLAAAGSACFGQQVTLTRIVGEGDILPDGAKWGGGGLAALEGDRIAFNATRMADEVICIYDIPTGALRIIADSQTDSPTYPGTTFKSLSNPAIVGDDVIFCGAALLYTSAWEGLYHATADGSGDVDVVVDEFFPQVRTPSLPMISEAGVVYRDRGYAGEPVFFTPLFGGITPVAMRGDAAPGGGTFFEMEPPAIGGNLVAFSAIINTLTDSLYSICTWDTDTGASTLVAQEGDPMPGSDAVFDVVRFGDTDGQRVLLGGRDDGFPDSYYGLYASDGGGLELLVQSGDPIPGRPGAVFDWIVPVAIDGDFVVFRADDDSGDFAGLFGLFEGRIVEIMTSETELEGAPIWNYNVTARAVSGNRIVINVGLDRLGSDAIYLAEIDSGCRADIDGDGELTFFDFLAFQNLFAAGDPRADFDGDGDLTFFDFLAFQNEFAAGCL